MKKSTLKSIIREGIRTLTKEETIDVNPKNIDSIRLVYTIDGHSKLYKTQIIYKDGSKINYNQNEMDIILQRLGVEDHDVPDRTPTDKWEEDTKNHLKSKGINLIIDDDFDPY